MGACSGVEVVSYSNSSPGPKVRTLGKQSGNAISEKTCSSSTDTVKESRLFLNINLG